MFKELISSIVSLIYSSIPIALIGYGVYQIDVRYVYIVVGFLIFIDVHLSKKEQ